MVADLAKIFLAGATAQASLIIATAADGQVDGWVSAVRELGSFGIIGVLLLGAGWFLKNAVPPLVDKFINQQEKRYESFLSALDSERALRERTMEAFRQMLDAHKSDLGAKMVDVRTSVEQGMGKLNSTVAEGNKISAALVAQLSSSPGEK